jgi:hypothetical protein
MSRVVKSRCSAFVIILSLVLFDTVVGPVMANKKGHVVSHHDLN